MYAFCSLVNGIVRGHAIDTIYRQVIRVGHTRTWRQALISRIVHK